MTALPGVVLSLFPGIDLLGYGFEREGFTVVRGPDPIFGGDIRRFCPPAGVFTGVIGGPPCQVFSRLRYMAPTAGKKHGNLIPEFERVVSLCAPDWFVMENVREAPLPEVVGYTVRDTLLNNRWLGEPQNRLRRFAFGTRQGLALDLSAEIVALEHPVFEPAVTAGSARPVPVQWQQAPGGGHRVKRRAKDPSGAPQQPRTVAQMCALQGLPVTFAAELPFTATETRRLIGNGVPVPMARAIARAVRRVAPKASTGDLWERPAEPALPEPVSEPLPLTPDVSRPAMAIYNQITSDPVSRAQVEATVLTLAGLLKWAGLTCASGDLGFPLWHPDAAELTPEQRRAAWELDVRRCHPLLLAEAWPQLWSRLPPKQRERYTPPGVWAVGTEGDEADDG